MEWDLIILKYLHTNLFYFIFCKQFEPAATKSVNIYVIRNY